MAIVNRDKHSTEQKEVLTVHIDTVTNGITLPLFVVPYPCTIESVRAVATGVSAAPALVFYKSPAAGITMESFSSASLVVGNLGVSGAINFSGLVATGSTLLDVPAGGIISMIAQGGVGAAATHVLVSMVVKKTQDIVSHFGANS